MSGKSMDVWLAEWTAGKEVPHTWVTEWSKRYDDPTPNHKIYALACMQKAHYWRSDYTHLTNMHDYITLWDWRSACKKIQKEKSNGS